MVLRADPKILFKDAAKKRCIEVAFETAEELRLQMPEDSGEMIDSVRVDNTRIGADVVIGVRYWKWVNNGTGIYGPTGQRISSTSGKKLHFFIDGVEFFVDSIAGQRGQHFVERTQEIIKRRRLKGFRFR
jgi:hypothetical protein